MAQALRVIVADGDRRIRRHARDDAERYSDHRHHRHTEGDAHWSPTFCSSTDDAWNLASLDRDGDMPAVQRMRRRPAIPRPNRTAIASATGQEDPDAVAIRRAARLAVVAGPAPDGAGAISQTLNVDGQRSRPSRICERAAPAVRRRCQETSDLMRVVLSLSRPPPLLV